MGKSFHGANIKGLLRPPTARLLFAIFIFVLLGATSAQFSGFLKKNILTIKILMAILFLSLGVFLIWRA